jgi:hypothetical protein
MITPFITNLLVIQDSHGPIFHFISMRISTYHEAQGARKSMTGQGNKETGNCPIQGQLHNRGLTL